MRAEPPLTYEEAKLLWRNNLENTYPSMSWGANASQTNSKRDNNSAPKNKRGAKNSGGSSRTKPSTGAIRMRAEVNGLSVCFDFNMDRCTKDTTGCPPNTCKDTNGAKYAHACNKYDKPNNKFCLQNHPRIKNH